MNIFTIIDEIQKIDPDFNDRVNPRRAAIKNITSFGSKIALAAMPFAIGTIFQRAYGAVPQAIIDSFNFALKLEFLESAFYTKGLTTTISSSPLIPAGGDTTAMTTISNHEKAHVAFLQAAIVALGGTAVLQSTQGTAGVYDFTAGGKFPTVFTNYDAFLTVANGLEDTGVRTYKGQAPICVGNQTLIGNQTLLACALGIHSVEARHAATIRQLRSNRTTGLPGLKGWVTGANDTGNTNFAANYAGEDNVLQGSITITNLMGYNNVNIAVNAATEAFDEPLTAVQVLPLIAPFGVK